MRFADRDIEDLLDAWPRLRRAPSAHVDVSLIEGWLEFSFEPPALPRIEDRYFVRIEVPLGQSGRLPEVFETSQRIHRDADHHVNSNGALCLGSPWRVRQLLGSPPSLVNLVESCMVPFLYAATWRERGNAGFPFSELAHGRAGLLQDYSSILGLEGPVAVRHALNALSRRRREANKHPCPCGCGRRLGRCAYRFRLQRLRSGMTRSHFRALRDQFTQEYPLEKPRRRGARKMPSWRSSGQHKHRAA